MSTVTPQDLGEVDRSSGSPIYQQIAERLRALIEDGVLVSGDVLPSGPELSRHFGVAPMTVREAISLLRNEGLAVAEKGKGVFVNAPPPLRTALRTLSLPQELPSLLGQMPSIPPRIGEPEDGAVASVSVEPTRPGSGEAILGVTARVVLEVAHGVGDLATYAISSYVVEWREPLEDLSIVGDKVHHDLHVALREVGEVEESIFSRMPTAHEVRRMAIPRDQPVTVVRHVGRVPSGDVLRAETVRDGRVAVKLA